LRVVQRLSGNRLPSGCVQTYMKVASFVSGVVAIAAVGLAQFQGDPHSSGKIPFQVISSGAYSKIQQKQTHIMRSDGEWQIYWEKMTGNPGRTAPGQIDWVKNRLVAINLGTRPTGGYSVKLKDLYLKGIRQAVAEVVEYTPSPDMMVTQAITSPFVVVQIPATGENLTFAWYKQETPRVEQPRPRPRPERCSCTCDCCRKGYCDDERHRDWERDQERDRNRGRGGGEL
jgi:hypothetical protein